MIINLNNNNHIFYFQNNIIIDLNNNNHIYLYTSIYEFIKNYQSIFY